MFYAVSVISLFAAKYTPPQKKKKNYEYSLNV